MTVERDVSAQESIGKTDSTDARAFVIAAVGEGAHLRKPDNPNLSEDSWIRMRNILGIYYGSPAVYEDIAKMYRFSNRERVRQLIGEGVRNLWNNCSGELKQTFSLEGLRLGKPQRSRERNSQLFKQLKTEEDKEKLKELMPRVTLSFYQKNIRGEDSLLMAVGNLTSGCGFHFSSTQTYLLIRVLEGVGIPLGKVSYEVKSGPQKGVKRIHFILRKHQQEARQALMAEQSLQRFLANPVEQICGERAEKSPKAADFTTRKRYMSVGSLFRELGLRFNRRRFPTAEFLEGCPVPVFRYRYRRKGRITNRYLYSLADKEEFAAFVRS